MKGYQLEKKIHLEISSGSKYNLVSQIQRNTACVNAALWHENNLKFIELLEAGGFIVSVTHSVHCAGKIRHLAWQD